jgi:hypothetical protein
LSDEQQRELREVQAYFRLPGLDLVEKDLNVVRAIRAVTSIDAAPFALIFGGGTALARAHRLVRRMSEDVDFKIVSQSPAPLSRNGLRRELGKLSDKVTCPAGHRLCVRRGRQGQPAVAEREPLHRLADPIRQRRQGRAGASADHPDRTDLVTAPFAGRHAAGHFLRR